MTSFTSILSHPMPGNMIIKRFVQQRRRECKSACMFFSDIVHYGTEAAGLLFIFYQYFVPNRDIIASIVNH